MNKKWFDTITGGICRGGGNGPGHPSQKMGLSLVRKGESLLDIGCGSATTTECIDENFKDVVGKYKGVDFIDHRIKYCKETFPKYDFEVQNAMNLKEKDNSWDVVWSRHVVDHLPSFEDSINEQIRVARKRVICVLWYSWSDQPEHSIKQIEAGGKTYENEYLNIYSIGKVASFLMTKYHEGWVFDIYFKVGLKEKAQDSIIHIYKRDERIEE
jgi:ubiquinone/menaquinone biosynthesis C-methylase UbiE